MNSVKNSPTLEFEKNNDVGLKIAKVIAFVLVLVGMLNTIPAIPGLEQLIWNFESLEKKGKEKGKSFLPSRSMLKFY